MQVASSNAANITQAAISDATRILTERSIDLNQVGEAEARTIMSEEHKALGYRPPHGSLASAAQAAAAKHPQTDAHIDLDALKKAALDDAARIAAERGQPPPTESITAGINLDAVGEEEARKLMSAEHKALGYRPPPGSLAADAQAAAAKHPAGAVNGLPKPDPEALKQAAILDAARIAAQRGQVGNADVNVKTVTKDEAKELMSEEHKILGFRPPPDSLAAQAQSEVDKRDSQPMTKDIAAEIFSEEHKRLGHQPPSGTLASTAQSLADKNEQDDGGRTMQE
ncbi:hypothetical protein HGRIS_006979 [Hohenbuehelia grisea]|uniref:SMP domain-containing protein n=1 Tax=Hohenbuehelia grisea TaxID=104357 RepID=A0ABR3JAS7_9AGAR